MDVNDETVEFQTDAVYFWWSTLKHRETIEKYDKITCMSEFIATQKSIMSLKQTVDQNKLELTIK